MSTTEDPKRTAIGHITYSLDQCASLVPLFAEYEAEHPHLAGAIFTSFMTEFRVLYSFLLGQLDSKRRDAHQTDFLPKWSPSKSLARQRLKELYDFINVHVAHLSWGRFRTVRNIEEWIPAQYLDGSRLAAASYARILSDYLDVLDEFIKRLPSKSDEQQLFFGAAFNARHKVNTFMGLPPPSPVLPT
jgi:hypothetical protein